MSFQLPDPIQTYFTSNRETPQTIAQCFTENAIVVDEGHTYQGREAIARWKAKASRQYQYTSKPFAMHHEDDGRIVVTSHVSDNFPGSPVDLRYEFVLEDGAIAHLEITL